MNTFAPFFKSWGVQGNLGDPGLPGMLTAQLPSPGALQPGSMLYANDWGGLGALVITNGGQWLSYLTGTPGATGAAGQTGPQGATGLQGPIGLQGNQGPIGLTGATGAQGAASTVTGPQGAIGPTGATGLTGPQGIQGLIGLTGPIGATGPQGTAGAQGIPGATGPAGLTGAASTVAGPQGLTGATGASGTPATFGNPTLKIGLTAVPGSGTVAMYANALPALDQTIAPTWTGAHSFAAGITATTGSFSSTLFASNLSGTNTGDQNLSGYALSSAIPVPAAPSALVGLAAINGSANTWMRSDGAPAINQGIAPTWTGTHTWTVAGTAVKVNVSGSAYGNSAPPSFLLNNTNASAQTNLDFQSSGTLFARLRGDGANLNVMAYTPTGLSFTESTGGAMGAGTVNTAGIYVLGVSAFPGSVSINTQTATSYTFVASDAGKCVSATATAAKSFTCAAGVFPVGSAFTVYNTGAGGALTLIQGTSTLVVSAALNTTGNRTLGGNAVATIFIPAANVFVVSGAGVT